MVYTTAYRRWRITRRLPTHDCLARPWPNISLHKGSPLRWRSAILPSRQPLTESFWDLLWGSSMLSPRPAALRKLRGATEDVLIAGATSPSHPVRVIGFWLACCLLRSILSAIFIVLRPHRLRLVTRQPAGAPSCGARALISLNLAREMLHTLKRETADNVYATNSCPLERP